MLSKILFLAVLMLLGPLYCFAQKFNKQAPLVDLKKIKEITIFYPSSWIEVLEEGYDQVHLNPSSLKSTNLNLELLDFYKGIFQTVYFFPEEDIFNLEIFSEDLRELADKAAVDATFENLKITPSLFLMMNDTETQYSMLVYHEGYLVGKKIGRARNTTPISIDGRLPEDFSPVPLSNLSNLYLFIMDKTLGHAVFARKVELSEVHPLRKSILAKQYRLIFKEFL